MIICVTGHRSERAKEATVRQVMASTLQSTKPNVVICGMANGVDLWAADEARIQGIEIWAAKPWAGHEPRAEDAELYARIIDYASRVVNVNESIIFPGSWCYQVRNEWMVDNCTHVLAYWDGTRVGGTWNCLKYAKKIRPIRNVF